VLELAKFIHKLDCSVTMCCPKYMTIFSVFIIAKPDTLTNKIISCEGFLQIMEKDYFFLRDCTLDRNRTESENLNTWHFLWTV